MKKSRRDIEGLKGLMNEHLAYRQGSERVSLLWAGYLAALVVEGIIDIQDYDALSREVRDVGGEELREVFAGYPGQFD